MSNNIWSNEINPFQKFKVLCHHDRMQKIAIGQFAAPVNIALDLVQGTKEKKMCAGVRCNFCMSDLEDKGEIARIPKDILLSIPKFYREWGVLSVCLAGHNSDPFVYNHDVFVQFIRLLYRNDIEAGINTNGIMLTDDLVEDVARNCKWTGFSINAGTNSTYSYITNTSNETFPKVINNIRNLTEYCKLRNINHPVCYKFLITDDNYKEIYDATVIARDIGCRQIQVRPCHLSEERSKKIDIKIVDEQLKETLTLEKQGEFEVFGIREKFTNTFTKKQPYKCIASPLGSTWKADGDIVICPDRRWSAHQPNMILGNYIKEGLENIRRKWGGIEHKAMIDEANKQIDSCIRCTSICWHDLYKNTVESDPMDYRLI